MRRIMDWDDEYEPAPTWRERILFLWWRCLPYAVGVLVLCAAVWIVCRFAALIEDRGAADQWGCVIESQRRKLKTGQARQ